MTDIEPDRRVRAAMNEVSWRNHKCSKKKRLVCMHPQAWPSSAMFLFPSSTFVMGLPGLPVSQINSSKRLKEAASNRAEADKVG